MIDLQVQELLADLHSAYLSGQEYFLGNIVTTRQGGAAGEPYWVSTAAVGAAYSAAAVTCRECGIINNIRCSCEAYCEGQLLLVLPALQFLMHNCLICSWRWAMLQTSSCLLCSLPEDCASYPFF
jgi:hypothetical protein